MKNEKSTLGSILDKRIIKGIVGFTEPLSSILDVNLQEILTDMMNANMSKQVLKRVVKYFFLNINLIYKTPISFQKFSALTVASVFNNKELDIHQYISLEWIVKYLTIYSILETHEEAAPEEVNSGAPTPNPKTVREKEQTIVIRDSIGSKEKESGSFNSRESMTPKERDPKEPSYSYIIDIIQNILENQDIRLGWVEDGIEILLKCICYPNLSASIQAEYLNLLRIVIRKMRYEGKQQCKYKSYIPSCLLIFLRNTLYSRNRTYAINLLNLMCINIPESDMDYICNTMSIILEKRDIQEDKHKVQEYQSLLNSLMRFMLGNEPDFIDDNKNIIGEHSKVIRPEVLNIIYEIYWKLDNNNRQKVLQEMIMLFEFDKHNTKITFQKTYFLEWVIEIIFQLEFEALEDEDMVDNRALAELSTKLVVTFLHIMMLETLLDRIIFYKFLATFEKKLMMRIKDMERDDLKNTFAFRIYYARSRIVSLLIDSVGKLDSETKAKHDSNVNNLPIRIVSYLFSHINVEDVYKHIAAKENAEELRFEDIQIEEASPWVSSGTSSTGDIMGRYYKFERFRAYTRQDLEKGIWVDEVVLFSLIRYLDHYIVYNNIEEFISDANDRKQIGANMSILYRIKYEKNEPKLLSSLLLCLVFSVDQYIEVGNIDKLSYTLGTLERLFTNIFALTEVERKNLKKHKFKYLDSILIYILYFLTEKRMSLLESRPQLSNIIARSKNRLWRGLVLTLKFDLEKLLTLNGNAKEDKMSISKVFSVFKGNSIMKPPSFVDDLFFKKFMITDIKKEDFKKEVELLYTTEDFFTNFVDTVQRNSSIRGLLETSLYNKETNRYEFALRYDTVYELYISIIEENKLNKQRKRVSNRMRVELEERIKDMQGNLEENFMSSDINAEMIMRECRFISQTMRMQQRDLNGLWSREDMRIYSQKDEPFNPKSVEYESIQINKYYKLEINEWTSHKFSRPFIKFRLKTYWLDNYNSIEDFIGEEKANEMNIFDRSSNKNRKNKKKLVPTKLKRNVRIFTQRILSTAAEGANKFLSTNSNNTPSNAGTDDYKIVFCRSCELLSKYTIYNGLIILNKKSIIFCTDNIKSKNYLSILNVELEKHDRVKMKWNIKDIIEIQRRRIVQRKTGLEIFFVGGFSIYINLPPDENDVQELHDLLMGLRESFTFSNPFSKIRSTRNQKLLEANKYTERWLSGEISNFHYLMVLNNYAGRSYHDLSQYPVFPWVMMLCKAKNDSKNEMMMADDFELGEHDLFNEEIMELISFRNMTKPVGALGTSNRVKTYLEKFDQSNSFSNAPNYHYGSHYSSPAIVLHYLIRLSPYTEGAKAIQNGHFDLADRLFFSINHTFKNAMEEMSDVRELIPEFYSIPEFFINTNKLDLGISQTGDRIHNVLLPKWAKGNPYIFVYIISRLLESTCITLTLKNWIDLIFGCKQVGDEAEKSMNIFYYLTYEDYVDMDDIRESDKQGIETQVVHFGQTPSKLFSKPHPGPASNNSSFNRVRSVNFNEDSIQVYSKKGTNGNVDVSLYTGLLNSYQDYNQYSIVKLLTSNGKRVLCMSSGLISNYSWELNVRSSTDMLEDLDEKMPFKFVRANRHKDVIFDFFADNSILKDKDRNLEMLSFPSFMLEESRIVIVGGYRSGMVAFYYSD